MTVRERLENRPSSFYDDAGVDQGFPDARDRHAEPDVRTVLDSRRHAQVDRLEGRQIADARALHAPVAPHPAAAAAFLTGPPNGNAERDDRAPERLSRRYDDVGTG